jgi:MraZ protein
MTLPVRVREQLDEPAPKALYFTARGNGSLWLGTARSLEQLAESAAHSLPPGSEEFQARRRLVFAQAERCTLTADGQLEIPKDLVRFAGLNPDVVVIGVGDHFEVWDAQHWHRYVQERIGPSLKPDLGGDQEEAETDE